MLDEGFERELSNTACAANCSWLVSAQSICDTKPRTKKSYESRAQLAKSCIGCMYDIEGDHDGCDYSGQMERSDYLMISIKSRVSYAVGLGVSMLLSTRCDAFVVNGMLYDVAKFGRRKAVALTRPH